MCFPRENTCGYVAYTSQSITHAHKPRFTRTLNANRAERVVRRRSREWPPLILRIFTGARSAVRISRISTLPTTSLGFVPSSAWMTGRHTELADSHLHHVVGSYVLIIFKKIKGLLSVALRLCRLPGCQRPCYIEGSRFHDYCGRSHAQQHLSK